MTRSALLLAAVLALPDVLAAGQQRPDGIGPFRTIRGRVVSADDSAARLRRVRIVLTGSSVTATPAHTDAEGRLETPVPQGAVYTLRLTKAGFAPLDVPGTALAAGDAALRMARGAAVAGRVVDQYGDPLTVRVRVRRTTDAAPSSSAAEWFSESDDLGEFRIGSLPAGAYEVALEPLNIPRGLLAAAAARPPIRVSLRSGQDEVLALTYDGAVPDPRGQVIGSSRAPVVENGGVLRGLVVGPEGRPVPGAFIALTREREGAREGTSDAEGRYAFNGLPAGTYRISAGKWGTALSMRDRNMEVRVAERQVVDAHVVMLRPSAIVGSVVDEFGEPIEGIMVEVGMMMGGPGGRAILQTQSMIARTGPFRTDDRGRFRVGNLRAGDYYVIAGEAPRVVGDTATGADTSLRVYYPGTPSIDEALTVGVISGQDVIGVHLTYVPTAGARVDGYAFDSGGQPLTFPVSMMESFRSGRPLMVRRETRVRADGAFSFLNVPPGEYAIQAVLRPGLDRMGEFTVQHIVIGAGDVPPVTLRTARGTRLSGRVVLEGDRANVKLDQFGLGVVASDLDYSPIGVDSSGAGVNEDGTFELRAQGPARITSRAAPRGWWLKSATIGSVDVADQPYTCAAQGERPLEVTVVFSDGIGEVTGLVKNVRGGPAGDWTVLAFPTDASRWYLGSRYLKLARPGSAGDDPAVRDGSFRIATMPPGEYLLVAVDRFDVATEWQDAEVLRGLAPLAQRVIVNERQQLVHDLPLVIRPR